MTAGELVPSTIDYDPQPVLNTGDTLSELFDPSRRSVMERAGDLGPLARCLVGLKSESSRHKAVSSRLECGPNSLAGGRAF